MLPFDDYMKTRANSTSSKCSNILFFHTTTVKSSMHLQCLKFALGTNQEHEFTLSLMLCLFSSEILSLIGVWHCVVWCFWKCTWIACSSSNDTLHIYAPFGVDWTSIPRADCTWRPEATDEGHAYWSWKFLTAVNLLWSWARVVILHFIRVCCTSIPADYSSSNIDDCSNLLYSLEPWQSWLGVQHWYTACTHVHMQAAIPVLHGRNECCGKQ